MNWLHAIFGAPELAKDVVDTTGSLIDNAFFTDQEKNAAAQKRLDWYLDLQKTLTQESTGTAAARRVFLLLITAQIILMANLSLALALMGHKDAVDTVLSIAAAFKLDWAFVAAVSFYFLTHVLGAAFPGKPSQGQ